MSAPLHEIHLNILEDQAPTKPLYGNSKRQSNQIIGNIIDCYDEQPTENHYQVEESKSKRKSRNKRIHIVYTQESSEGDQ